MRVSDRVRFGAEIRAQRNRLGLSQDDLAERAALHRNTIGKIERDARAAGDVPEAQLILLSHGLGLSIEDLRALSPARSAKESAVRSDDDVDLKVPAELAARIQAAADEAGKSVVDYLADRFAPAPKKAPNGRMKQKQTIVSARTSKGERKQTL